MPRQKNTLFSQKLASYDVLINDTTPESTYFGVSQFPDGLTGGKNGFLISGTPLLEANSKILVEVINSDGQTIYHEPVRNYMEGRARLLSFEVYEDTPPGIYTVILLGQAVMYANGVQVPSQWRNSYNVRWTRKVIV